MEATNPSIALGSHQDEEEGGLDLHQLIGTLLEAKWLIASIAGVVFALGLSYAYIATPIYRSDALVQVELGSRDPNALSELTSLLSTETPAETEIEVIRSRSVVGAAVEQLKLDMAVMPEYFPVIGRFMARRHVEKKLAEPWLGLGNYAWGGEQLRVDRITVPRALENKKLVLIAGEGGAYRLVDSDQNLLAEGKIGQAVEGAKGVSLFVTTLVARPGTRFIVIKRPYADTVAALQSALQVKERGKKTGVIEVALEGSDPARAALILDTLVNGYIRQNVERHSEEAQKMLEFLNTQLPRFKGELVSAETALGKYRATKGAVDLSMEANSYLSTLTQVETQIAALNLQKVEMGQRFTEQHPLMVALKEKIAALKSEKERVNTMLHALPESELEAVGLERDAKIAGEVYMMLMNKAQELSVTKAGAIGSVHVLDKALVPLNPIKPKKAMVISVAMLLGISLGVAVAFLRQALMKGVEDPDVVERRLGIPVYATVPFSGKQGEEDEVAAKKGGGRSLLSVSTPHDLAVESVRSLRTSLQFALLDSPNNIISITGPSPGIGKSFISANLAVMLAEAGKRVLLIDGDMRKGHLHEYFGYKRTDGLSGLVSGEVSLAEAVKDTEIANLKFVPAGIVPPNPAELLMSDRFRETVHELAAKFDNVIIDTPPILAVTDPAIVGRLAGINFIVLRAGAHHPREIDACYKRLVQNGVKPQGVVFNGTNTRRGGYGYYGKYGKYAYAYQYEYK